VNVSTTIDTPVSKSRCFSKAAASIVFACASIFLVRAHGFVHWRILSRHYGEIPESVRPELFATMSRLVMVAQCLAVAALVWCIWSWRTESRFAAALSTTFTIVAVFLALAMVMT
jgi:hypothetical protein